MKALFIFINTTAPAWCYHQPEVVITIAFFLNVAGSYDQATAESMNTITPNGDGTNDKWIAWRGNCVAYASVTVFNRYGTLVFQSGHYQNDWEGMYKGKPLPGGTYYAVTTYRLNNGKEIIKRNDLTILR